MLANDAEKTMLPQAPEQLPNGFRMALLVMGYSHFLDCTDGHTQCTRRRQTRTVRVRRTELANGCRSVVARVVVGV